VSEIRRLRQLEDENRRLKQLVADLTLDKTMLQDVLRELWREDYNRVRPHSSLANMTPEEFVQQTLGAHPMGVGRAPTARHQRPNDNGRKSASQAEDSHCGWHQDGGKTKAAQYHITTGITSGGRST